jgi:hypothetical protein
MRGQPSGFNDIDSDDETDKSLLAREQRLAERELNSRREFAKEVKESRFILVKEGEDFLGESSDQNELTHAYGVFGNS